MEAIVWLGKTSKESRKLLCNSSWRCSKDSGFAEMACHIKKHRKSVITVTNLKKKILLLVPIIISQQISAEAVPSQLSHNLLHFFGKHFSFCDTGHKTLQKISYPQQWATPVKSAWTLLDIQFIFNTEYCFRFTCPFFGDLCATNMKMASFLENLCARFSFFFVTVKYSFAVTRQIALLLSNSDRNVSCLGIVKGSKETNSCKE